jgi:bifunctional non-homologous end joining protein LigD
MEHLIDRTKSLLRSRILATNGLDAFRIARRRGYEGVVAKDLSSSYMEARSTKWLKVKIRQEEEYVICGYTRPAGSRSHFGALLLGAYSGKALHYVGKVGTGFDEATLAKLHQELLPLVRSESALVDPPREKGIIFVKPKYIAQISFQEWTTDKKLRQPVYLGLRDDKDFRDVRLPDPSK